MPTTEQRFMGEVMTPREIRIARYAYAKGAEKATARRYDDPGYYKVSAAHEFPLPTVTRPRVVVDSVGVEFRVVGDAFYYRGSAPCGEWRGCWGQHCVATTPERVRLWADLLANPTETVEAEV